MFTGKHSTSLKKTLVLSFVVQITIIMSIVLVLLNIVNQSNAMVEKQREIMKIQESSVSLMMIANEQLLDPSVRAFQQWQILTQQLKKSISLNTELELTINNRALTDQLNEIEKTMNRIHSETLTPQMLSLIRPTMVSQIYNLIALSKQRLKTSQDLYLKAKKQLLKIVAILSFFGILFPSLMFFVIFKRVLNPVHSLIDSTKSIANKEFNKAIPPSQLIELNTLVNAMNHMRITLLNEMALKSDLITEIEKTTLAEQQAQFLLKQLKDNQTKMIQMEKLSALGSMVGGVAHELNNPLMGVHNYIEYSLNKISDDKISDKLKRAIEELERVQRIITNMLIFSRNDHSVDLTNLNLSELLDNVITLMKPGFKNNGIVIKNNVDDQLVIHSNADILKQVLVNLLANARDALKDTANPIITISVKQSHDKTAQKLLISDNGEGIKDKDLDHIFDPFFTTKPPGVGTGLGLSISRELIKTINSELTLEETSPNGTIFSIFLSVNR